MTARYEEVARSLARQIETGNHPIGSKLPTEIELAAQYAVSRATVRSALDSLERQGLVTRRRRVGTTVVALRPTGGYARTVSSMQDLVQYSTETTREVVGVAEIVADEDLARLLGVRAGQHWAHVRMLRLDQRGRTQPVCHTDVYLTPEVAELVGDRLEQPEGLISEIVEQVSGRLVDKVAQRISAVAVPVELAEVLGVPVGAPALRIVRRYVEASGAVSQVTVSVHPADRFEYSVEMERRTDL